MQSAGLQKQPVDTGVTERKGSQSSVYSSEKTPIDPELQEKKEIAHDDAEPEEAQAKQSAFYARYRPLILGGVAAVILGWWISATVLKATRHRWCLPFLLSIGDVDADSRTQILVLKDRSDSLGLVFHLVSSNC